MFCTKCGAKVDDGSKFCNFCGQAIETVSDLTGSNYKQSQFRTFKNSFKVSRKTGVLFLLPLLVLLLGIYWIFIRYSGPDEKFVHSDVANFCKQAYAERYGKDSTYVPDIQVKVGGGKKSHKNVVFVPVEVNVNEKMEKKEITQPNGRKYTRTYGDNTNKIMYYLFVYQKNEKDKQWIRKYVYPSELEKWELKPIAGIEDDRFRSTVAYKLRETMGAFDSVKNNSGNKNMKINNINILSRNINLAKGTEEIDFSCDFVNNNYIQQYRDIALLQFDYNFPDLILNPHWKIVGFKSKMK